MTDPWKSTKCCLRLCQQSMNKLVLFFQVRLFCLCFHDFMGAELKQLPKHILKVHTNFRIRMAIRKACRSNL
jgi:hypothetical protein